MTSPLRVRQSQVYNALRRRNAIEQHDSSNRCDLGVESEGRGAKYAAAGTVCTECWSAGSSELGDVLEDGADNEQRTYYPLVVGTTKSSNERLTSR